MTLQEARNKNEIASRQMQQKILRSTVEIIGSEGFVAVTASRLSREAGISKGALYHHFANLDEVRMRALEFLLELFIPSEPLRSASFRDWLRATGESLYARTKRQPVAMKALYAYMVQALVDRKLKAEIGQLVTGTLEEYSRVIGRFFPNLSDEQQQRLVLILDAFFGGSVLHWFLLDDEAACRGAWEQFSDMLLATLEASEWS